MATYHGLLHDWKILSAGRVASQSAYTVAGHLSLQTDGANQGIMDLAPLSTISPERHEHERRRLIEDAEMLGFHITREAKDRSGAYHWRVTIERGEVTA